MQFDTRLFLQGSATYFVRLCKLLLWLDHPCPLLPVSLLTVVVQLVASNLLAVVSHVLQILVLYKRNSQSVVRIGLWLYYTTLLAMKINGHKNWEREKKYYNVWQTVAFHQIYILFILFNMDLGNKKTMSKINPEIRRDSKESDLQYLYA